jgi:DNA-binding protein H-NS
VVEISCEELVAWGRNGRMSKNLNLESMSVDDMWELHEEIGRLLSARLTLEKRELEERLQQLRQKPLRSGAANIVRAPRRKYPRVHPKYRNSQQPFETWSGRGKTPRWLVAALGTGHKLEEFAIKDPISPAAGKRKIKTQYHRAGEGE